MKHILYILSIFLILLQANKISAQCSEKLMIEAASKSGSNAIFMRDFRVHLQEGTIKNPVPYKKVSVMLSKNVVYRFTVSDSKELSGRLLLQLFNKGEMLGSTYDLQHNTPKENFDFRCSHTGMYQVLLSFVDGKEGCGIGVMSMVLHDSLSTIDPAFRKVEGKGNVMFLGIDNEFRIASDQISDGKINVTISQGVITESNGVYIAKPDQAGKAIVYVNIYDSNNNLKTQDSVEFSVVNAPLPQVTLNGKTGGFISKSNLSWSHALTLQTDYDSKVIPFEIVGFSIQRSKFDVQSLTSGSAQFSNRQIQFLQTLQSGDTFIITHILVKGADKKVYELNSLGFIVD